jgi:hypothetical protein
MRIGMRVCVLFLLAALFGCGGNAQAERLVEDNLRLTDQYAEALEQIGKIPDAQKIHEIQEKITKIQAEMKANTQALKAFPMAVVEEIQTRHKEESERVRQRLLNSNKIYRDKMPNLKKNLTPG